VPGIVFLTSYQRFLPTICVYLFQRDEEFSSRETREAQKEYSSNGSDEMKKKESFELAAWKDALFPLVEDYTIHL